MKILILEDNQDRIDAFNKALEIFADMEILIWRDALSMIQALPEALPETNLISLDHDLVSRDGTDPGDGLDVAKELKNHPPVCPVLIHSTNIDRSWSMLNELKEGDWDVERHPPIGMGESWIHEYWIKAVREKAAK